GVGLPWLLIGLPAGVWVDRLPRRPVMVACDLASLLLFLSVPAAAWAGVLTFAHLLAVAFGTGVASVFFQCAYQVYLPCLLTPDQLPEGNAKLQGTESVAQVGGPGVAGLIVQLAGSAVTALLVDAASFLISALCLLGIRAGEPEPRPRRRSSTLRREIAEGLRFVARDPYLRVLTVFGAASNFWLVGYQAILVVFLIREVGVGPGAVGAVMAGMSCGGVLGAVVATRIARRFGTARGMLLAELVAMPAGLLIPLARPGAGLACVVAGGVIVGAGVVAGNVIKGSWRQVYTPHHLLGRVISSMQLVNLGTIPVGAVLAGALGGALGLRPAMWVLTGGMALTWFVLLIGPLRRHRDLPTHPRPRVADPTERPGPAGDGGSTGRPVPASA
ncbi:MFS transporter, partial [Micromonospora zhanjiangensis]